MTPEQAKQYEVMIFTLDTHEYFGPFTKWLEAHSWAKTMEITSYQVKVVPATSGCD